MSPPARQSGACPRRRGPDAQTVWLTGFHPVREALRARRRPLELLWLREGALPREHEALVELARAAGIPVERVAASRIADRSGPEGNDQGVALRAGPLPELDLAGLLALAADGPTADGPTADGPMADEPDAGRRLLALDGVEDPQNLGALARVAESAGVAALLLTRRRAPALGAAVARASAGAIEWLPVARVPNLGRALAALQSAGFWVVAATPEAKTSLFEAEDRILTGNLVVVLGAEGRGVRPSVLDQADHQVEIPMRGRIASLNVSTAGAILLYDLLRRAEASHGDPSGVG